MGMLYQPPYYSQQYASQFNAFQPQMMPQQQQYGQMQGQPPAWQQQTGISPQGGIVWVQGKNEADNYPVAPNSAVALWDSNAPCVYLKQADASGKPVTKVYDIIERKTDSVPPQQAAEYIKREEFDRLKAMVEQMQSKGVIKDAEPSV